MVQALSFLFLWTLTAASQPGPDDPLWYPKSNDGRPEIQLYFFWSRYCKHCAEARPFVEALARDHPWLRLRALEVGDNRENTLLYIDLAGRLGREASSVPGFLFCGEMHTGYGPDTGTFMLERLSACRERLSQRSAASVESGAENVDIPLLGSIDPGTASLPLVTVILASVDAFNPCAFFVLLFLLSLMVHARSRARMALVGGTFVLVSGLVYFLFMAAWLNAFLLFGELRVVTVIAGLAALLIGILNVKDYFWFGRGPTLSISAQAKPRLFERMRGLANKKRLLPLISATLVLAVAANSYELLCTAGFPLVFSRILTLNSTSAGGFYGYLLLYNLIYIIPLAIIVTVFVATLGSRRLSERDGRRLKLLSGSMMALLGGLLLIGPQYLDNALVAFALLLTAVVIVAVAESWRHWRQPR